MRDVKFVLFLLIISICLSGCWTAKYNYTPPSIAPNADYSLTIQTDKNGVFKKLNKNIITTSDEQFLQLGEIEYLKIDQVDKKNGKVILSYEGDPERFVDCGKIYSYFKNMAGERVYDFPASKAYQCFEKEGSKGMQPVRFSVTRKLMLEAKPIVTIKEISPGESLLKVVVEYNIEAIYKYRSATSTNHFVENITFKTGQEARLSDSVCQSSGRLENRIILLFAD